MMTERVFPGYLVLMKVRNGATHLVVAATEKSKDRFLWIKDHLGAPGNLAITVKEDDPIRVQASVGGIQHREGEEGGNVYLVIFEIKTEDAAPFAEVLNQRCVVDFTPTPKPPATYPYADVGVVDLRRSGPVGPQHGLAAGVRTGEFPVSEAELEGMGLRKTKREA